MPRFVILEHDHPILHWDLMLEAGDALRTWRLERAPVRGATIVATALGDHRPAYLDYEGQVSGGRGMVKRWDAGTYQADPCSDGSARSFAFDGTRIQGHARLCQIGGNDWRFEWLDE